MSNEKKPPSLKTLRILGIVLLVLTPLCWLICNSVTYAVFVDPNIGFTVTDILRNAFYFAACWLPVPSLGCALAALVLTKKSRPQAAATLLIVAAGLLVPSLVFLLPIL